MKELLWNMFEISVNVSEILMVYQKAWNYTTKAIPRSFRQCHT